MQEQDKEMKQPSFMRPTKWTLLLTDDNYGIVGEYGSKWEDSPAHYDRVNVVAEPAHPTPSQAWEGELPEPDANECHVHIYPSDLARMEQNETTATTFSVAVGCLDEESVPLLTVEQTKDYARKAIGAAVAGVRDDAQRYQWIRQFGYQAHEIVFHDDGTLKWGAELDAAIDAIRSLRSNPVSPAKVEVPEGWQLVPIKETPAMVEAYINTRNTGFAGSPAHASHVWEAMLAVAPHPVSQQDGEKGGVA